MTAFFIHAIRIIHEYIWHKFDSYEVFLAIAVLNLQTYLAYITENLSLLSIYLPFIVDIFYIYI